MQPGSAGLAPHKLGDLEGEDAGEHVHADVVVGPVLHRGERHDVRVFELAEGELGVGLGAVGGDDIGDRPVVAVGDEHALAEDLVFQRAAGVGVDVPGQPLLGGGCSPVSCQSTTRRTQVSPQMVVISASTWSRGRRALPRARVAASSSSLLPALARVV